MVERVLEVRGLTVDYRVPAAGLFTRARTLRAVDDVSFDVAAGETLGIVGESGSGKSTLARAVLQLVRPAAGRVVLLGDDLARLSPRALRARRRDMQVVFQDPLGSLDPRMPVHEAVAEPLRVHARALTRGERQRRVDAALAQVGLAPNLANRYPHELSGGQCQRAAIARALVVRPRLLVCDEPVSALDVSIRAQVVNLLGDLQRELGLAMVFIAHDLAIVRHVAHRVLVMQGGRAVETADRDALYANPQHPYTRALLAAATVAPPRPAGAHSTSTD